jgi:MFS family permease
MRPVGGVLLGLYADRRGRKAALLMVVGLMTIAIALIAFAPTYAAIGVGAPLIIVLARTPIALAFYLMFRAAIGLLAAMFLKERSPLADLAISDVVEPHAA